MSARLPETARVALVAWLATMLTSLALFPTLESKAFVLPAAVGGLVVVATGVALRAVGAPRAVVPPVQALAVVEWCLLTYAGEQLRWYVVPTLDAFGRLAERTRAAFEVIAAFATPVPEHPGLTMLTAVGVVLCVLAVDVIALGLRQVPWAGLPLLALYTVPSATVIGGLAWYAFVPGAVGYVLLLAAEEHERLTRWGRAISLTTWGTREGDRVSTGALYQSGRRIGLAAVALAVVVPATLPMLPENIFGQGLGGGSGNESITIENPLVDLRRDLVQPRDVDVIRVTTDDPDPSYLRLVVLDVFDGVSWQPSTRSVATSQAVDGPLPPPPGVFAEVARDRRAYSISVSEGFDSRWLPVYYPTRQVRAEGDWRVDPTTLDVVTATGRSSTAGLTYDLTAVRVLPTRGQLLTAAPTPPRLDDAFTTLPADLPERIRRLAVRVTSDADTAFQRAVALQDWFRANGRFGYSTAEQAGNTTSDLTNFLFVDRRGYCEQFAASMAILARSIGIPARVAVGFLQPERDPRGTTETFSTRDLHAWPELYFHGVGWVRFEPTPSTRPGGTFAPPYTERDPAGSGNFGPGGQARDPLADNRLNREGIQGRAPERPGGATDLGGGAGVVGWLTAPVGVAALLLVLFLTPALARVGLRRWRWSRAATAAEQAEAAWLELADTCRDLGIPWRSSATPRSAGAGLAREVGPSDAARAGVARLVRAVERARYARSPGSFDGPRDDLRVVTATLAGRATRGARLRARWLPASLPGRLAGGVAGVRDRVAARRLSSRTRVGAASAPRLET